MEQACEIRQQSLGFSHPADLIPIPRGRDYPRITVLTEREFVVLYMLYCQERKDQGFVPVDPKVFEANMRIYFSCSST